LKIGIKFAAKEDRRKKSKIKKAQNEQAFDTSRLNPTYKSEQISFIFPPHPNHPLPSF